MNNILRNHNLRFILKFINNGRTSVAVAVMIVGCVVLLESVSLRRAHASTFTVTNTNDSGAGSLRQAITSANGNAGIDTINFNIPGGGVHTISPTSPLPDITEPVIIDGTTQSGWTPFQPTQTSIGWSKEHRADVGLTS